MHKICSYCKYTLVVLLEYFQFLYIILEANIVLFTALHSFDTFSYYGFRFHIQTVLDHLAEYKAQLFINSM